MRRGLPKLYHTVTAVGIFKRMPGGVTLIESLVAIAILSIVVLGVAYVGTAAQKHLHLGDARLRASRLAEDLMEEIASRPYSGSGSDRVSFCVDDYDAFMEAAGELYDFTETAYPTEDQFYSRAVTVTPFAQVVPELGGVSITGKQIVVTVRHTTGATWQLTRVISSPIDS